ncbi:MAG: hypothetical protein QM305_12850 [Bacteroidota bacterium]|nr:hypothetical protein [Bacteroidota bacterium]
MDSSIFARASASDGVITPPASARMTMSMSVASFPVRVIPPGRGISLRTGTILSRQSLKAVVSPSRACLMHLLVIASAWPSRSAMAATVVL